ncbi:MAG: LytTR family DNA-binding domain-containing protein [Pseudomonadota bacterium]
MITQRRIYLLGLPLILGIGAGLTGPFGTYVYAPPIMRTVYWLIVVLAGYGLWWGIGALGKKLIPEWPYEWGEVIIAIPFSFLNPLLLVGLHAGLNAAVGSRFPTVWSDFVASHLMLSVFVILPVVYLARQIILEAETSVGRQAIDLLFEKLPLKLRGATPFALAAEGNYVRVYTERGDDLVTSTFEEALRAVSGIPGVRTHRSWWVAENAVRKIEKSGSSFLVILASGQEVPLGRRRRAALEAIIARVGASA